MRVCFIGHRTIEITKELKKSLKETVESIIKKGVTTFYFGSKSQFNDLSWEIVTDLKGKYPHIKRVYIRSAYQHISKLYEDYLHGFYEETYFPPKIEKAGRYAHVERNYEMIDNSKYCVFYYNEKYQPHISRHYKNSNRASTSCNSGTRIAYEYAVRKGKIVINLYEKNINVNKVI